MEHSGWACLLSLLQTLKPEPFRFRFFHDYRDRYTPVNWYSRRSRAGLITLSAVLTMFGLPLEVVALIAGVDAIIGMGGTATNVVGDMVGAAVVDRTERKKIA